MEKYLFLIPVFNDWKSLNILLGQIDSELSISEHEFSVVIVNDELGYARVVTPTEIEDVSLYDAVRVKLEQLGNLLCPTIE